MVPLSNKKNVLRDRGPYFIVTNNKKNHWGTMIPHTILPTTKNSNEGPRSLTLNFTHHGPSVGPMWSLGGTNLFFFIWIKTSRDHGPSRDFCTWSLIFEGPRGTFEGPSGTNRDQQGPSEGPRGTWSLNRDLVPQIGTRSLVVPRGPCSVWVIESPEVIIESNIRRWFMTRS